MAGYNSVNLLEGRPGAKSGEVIKFKISENDVAGFTLTWNGITPGTVEHSFDGGATWITVTPTPVTATSIFYTPSVANTLFGPLGRITFGFDEAGSVWYARRT